MWGVCWVHNNYGGSGSFVGGVCRTTRHWWTGKRWVQEPVEVGPFHSKVEADNFAKEQKKCRSHSFFTYISGDPYGEGV